MVSNGHARIDLFNYAMQSSRPFPRVVADELPPILGPVSHLPSPALPCPFFQTVSDTLTKLEHTSKSTLRNLERNLERKRKRSSTEQMQKSGISRGIRF